MQPHPKAIIWRHRKENLKKCSLHGLESRDDLQFCTYPNEQPPNLGQFVMLSLDGEPLSKADAERGIFLIDGTWRYAEKMESQLQQTVERRSLPGHFRTAYPRKQEDCADPTVGLASVEALFIAYHTLGWPTEGLLDHYYWGEKFLQMNSWE